MSKMHKLQEPRFKTLDGDALPALDMEEGRTMLRESYKQVHRVNKKGRKLDKFAMINIHNFSFSGESRVGRKRRVDRFRHKVSVLQSLRHTNIVRMSLAVEGPSYKALFTEFLPFALHQYLDEMTGNEPQSCVTQLTDALCYLHTRRIVHGDLKLANVLTDQNSVFKLCGFGSAQVLPRESDKPNSWTGTPEYRAPELDNHSMEQNAFKMESYSFGVLSWCILLGNRPSHLRGYILTTVKSSSRLEPVNRECLTLLLALSPNERATIFQIRDIMERHTLEARPRLLSSASSSLSSVTRDASSDFSANSSWQSQTTGSSPEQLSPSVSTPEETDNRIPVLIGEREEICSCEQDPAHTLFSPDYFAEMLEIESALRLALLHHHDPLMLHSAATTGHPIPVLNVSPRSEPLSRDP
ncbi:serine/threonine-protein kinase plo1-like [Aplysia californica]|uniref:Serine/threonine-protein kinase plo1-like n=1 Tax=Aplysia californica TaxID=6500 RepID=A0ABM0K6L1_APLCA|nr:serine/threonine-protein kinase plo1-like [Aplysia californica]